MLKPSEIGVAQRDIRRAEILLQPVTLGGAGIGTIHGFRVSRSTNTWFFSRASGVNRGGTSRKSFSPSFAYQLIAPVLQSK